MSFALARAMCWALRLTDVPRGSSRWYRLTLWALERRYRLAEAKGGRDYARPFDYIPF